MNTTICRIGLGLLMLVAGGAQAKAQSTPPGRTSKVPRHTFPATLAEQEAELNRNPLLWKTTMATK